MKKKFLFGISIALLVIFGAVIVAAQRAPVGPFDNLLEALRAMNLTGPQGPSGPQGERGDVGPAGPQGEPSEVNVIIEQQGQQVDSFFDVFVEIDGAPGESKDEKHRDWIDVFSYSHGMTQTGSTTGGGGAGAGKVNHQDFNFVKRLDKSSVKLYEFINKGQHIPKVTIELVRKSGDKQKFMEYKFEDVLITGIQTGSSTDQMPTEQVSFTYGKIEWKYTEQKEDGSAGQSHEFKWDIEANRES